MKRIQDANSSYLLQMRGSAEDTIPAENVELKERETWNPEEGEQKISFITAGDSARPSCFCCAPVLPSAATAGLLQKNLHPVILRLNTPPSQASLSFSK